MSPTYKLVCITSGQRTGSTWAYNVARHILTFSGATIQWAESIESALKNPAPPGAVWLLKTHKLLPLNVQGARLIVTYRDPRDIVISHMRFMRSRFEAAMWAAREAIKTIDYYMQGGEAVLQIRYPNIRKYPDAIVAQVASHLAIPVMPNQVAELLTFLDRDRIKSLTHDNDTEMRRRIEAGEQLPAGWTAPRPDGGIRFIEQTTGFQTNHVTSEQDGEWRTALTTEQQAQMQKEFGPWIERHGFGP